MEAISHAGTVLGVLSKDGIVLAAEKKITGKLLDMTISKDGGYGGSGEKIFLVNKYVSLMQQHPQAQPTKNSRHLKQCYHWGGRHRG